MQTTIAPPTPSLVSLTWFLKFVNKCVRPFPYLPQPRTYIDCVVRSIKKQFTKTAPTRITWLIELGVARSPIIKCFYKHLSCGRSSKEWWGGEMSSTSYISPLEKKFIPLSLFPLDIFMLCVYTREEGRREKRLKLLRVLISFYSVYTDGREFLIWIVKKYTFLTTKHGRDRAVCRDHHHHILFYVSYY